MRTKMKTYLGKIEPKYMKVRKTNRKCNFLPTRDYEAGYDPAVGSHKLGKEKLIILSFPLLMA